MPIKAALLLMLFISCSVVDEFTSRDFIYYEGDRRKNFDLKVPKGYTEEKVVLDTSGGKEQYYNYKSGALLYFSKDVISWTSENRSFIDSMQGLRQKNTSGNYTYKGRDQKGLYWKEVRMDRFLFGYSYVPAAELEKFETALNSIRIR